MWYAFGYFTDWSQVDFPNLFNYFISRRNVMKKVRFISATSQKCYEDLLL